MEDSDFQSGVDAFEASLRTAFKRQPPTPIVDWLEDAIETIPYSPRPGPYRRESAPWIIEPLTCAADPAVSAVFLLACVQASKSQLLEMVTAHIVARDPGPTLALQDKDENADDWLKTRLRELWKVMPDVASRLKEADTTKGSIVLPNMSFWALGARNPRNLQRRSIRWLLADETWLWPKGALAEAMARLTAFGPFGKFIGASQGSLIGDDTDEFWKTTTQEEWSFECPSCKTVQAFDDAQLVYPEGSRMPDGDWDFAAVRSGMRYKCNCCDHHFSDTNATRSAMNATGRYVATNAKADPKKRGFRWNCLAVRSWGGYAEQLCRAKALHGDTGDDTLLRQVQQKQMARPYEPSADEDSTFVSGDYMMAEEWKDQAFMTAAGKIVARDDPAAVYPLRICTVDCQKFGFWAMVRSWNMRGESRLRAWSSPRSWRELDAFVASHGVHRSLVFADAGNATDETFVQLKARAWSALRGDQRTEFPWRIADADGRIKTAYRPYSPRKSYLTSEIHKVPVFYFSTLATKDVLARLRKRGRWKDAKDSGPEYIEQMESERRVIRADGKPEWQLIRKNNHLFDCASMQVCVAMQMRLVGGESERIEEGDTAKD